MATPCSPRSGPAGLVAARRWDLDTQNACEHFEEDVLHPPWRLGAAVVESEHDHGQQQREGNKEDSDHVVASCGEEGVRAHSHVMLQTFMCIMLTTLSKVLFTYINR